MWVGSRDPKAGPVCARQEFEHGVDEATELGFFADDERTTTMLPRKLKSNAALATKVASELHNLAGHCKKRAAAAARPFKGLGAQ